MCSSDLAIVKAGAAYVPIDPDYPSARKAFMVADAGVRVIITKPDVMAGDELPGVTRVMVGHEATSNAARTDDHEPAPDALAYVLYTSGSTGQPKGVGITHRALANHMRWMARTYPL